MRLNILILDLVTKKHAKKRAEVNMYCLLFGSLMLHKLCR